MEKNKTTEIYNDIITNNLKLFFKIGYDFVLNYLKNNNNKLLIIGDFLEKCIHLKTGIFDNIIFIGLPYKGVHYKILSDFEIFLINILNCKEILKQNYTNGLIRRTVYSYENKTIEVSYINSNNYKIFFNRHIFIDIHSILFNKKKLYYKKKFLKKIISINLDFVNSINIIKIIKKIKTIKNSEYQIDNINKIKEKARKLVIKENNLNFSYENKDNIDICDLLSLFLDKIDDILIFFHFCEI